MKTNGKKIIDWVLAVLFVGTAISGIKLHVAGDAHPVIDHTWFVWAWLHGIAAFAFVAMGTIHAMMHKNWCKSLTKRATNRTARVRRIAVLSLDAILVLLLMSGVWLLLFPLGDFVKLGAVHYVIGLLSIAFAIGHILKRIKLLK